MKEREVGKKGGKKGGQRTEDVTNLKRTDLRRPMIILINTYFLFLSAH